MMTSRPGKRVGSGRVRVNPNLTRPELWKPEPNPNKFGSTRTRPEFGSTRICQTRTRPEFPNTNKMNGENTGQPVFDPNPTRIPTRILTWPEFRLPIPDPNLIRVKRVDPFLTRTRICPTHTRKFGSGSGSGRRVGYKLPGLNRSLPFYL